MAHSTTKKLNLLGGWTFFFSICACAQTQSPSTIGELFPTEQGTNGSALLAGTGMSVTGGSQLSAGESVAALILKRGGQVRICPRSTLSVNTVPNNEGLMLALDTGSVEINYPINALADTLITPDFKILLAGPGTFHFSLGVNSQGDTCVKPARGNTSSIIISEMLGSAIYQVKPDETVLFSKGKLAERISENVACGCPAPPPVLRAESNPTSELPPEKPGEVQVKVDVPLVFRAGETAVAPPEPSYAVAQVRFSTLPDVFFLQEKVEPIVLEQNGAEVSSKKAEAAAKKKEKKGFFGRMKGFFSSVFH